MGNYGACNISCNWMKTVIYSFPNYFVDFALSAVTCQAEIWSQARGSNLLRQKLDDTKGVNLIWQNLRFAIFAYKSLIYMGFWRARLSVNP